MTPQEKLVRAAMAVGSFAAMAVGFWLAWAPLGLIVPGAIVFGSLTYSHLAGAESEEQEEPQGTIRA